MLRLGLVGTGDAGKHHARALLAVIAERRARWTAVVIRDPAEDARLRDALAIPAEVISFPSLAALLESRACDAVILATPDGLHVEQVVGAAGHGVHVLVEKPLALSRADGARAVSAVRAAGVHLAVGYHLRHHAAHRLVQSRSRELIGELRTIFVRWAWPDPATTGWRARGEKARFWSLAALGTHAIDLAFMFADLAEVGAVAAVLEPVVGIDRAAEVSLGLGQGRLAHISVSIGHRAPSRVILTGDAGEVEAIGTLGARGDGELWHRVPRQDVRSIPFAAENPYLAQLRAFISASNEDGFVDDPALLANLDVLDRIRPAKDNEGDLA